MYLIRPILILLVFFGGLYYFREPLRSVPEKFDALHSPYVQGFKSTFKDILNASSTTILNGLSNYVPSQWNAPLGNINNASGGTATSTSGQSSGSNATSTVKSSTSTNQSPRTNTGELLPVTSNQKEQSLSVNGIVLYTNQQRAKAGLRTLSIDSELNKAAEDKLQDMFKNQYFQHVSPSGESVSDVARKAGYEFIVVGENLALGIFAGDDQVVAAWMASPGHKRNILDVRYQDIGVAVGQGMYKGRKQWLIVQHFGKPLSACASPNQNLKSDIEIMRKDIVTLEAAISAKKAETERLSGDAYARAASEYNTLVVQYNGKLQVLKDSINTYNATVRKFNECAGLEEDPV